MKLPTIVIDPGHGGRDPGAVSAGVQEKDIALLYALMLGHELRAIGFDTAFTRTDDRFMEVMDRADIAKAGDIFVSCHVNSAASPKANGLSVWYHGDHASSKKLGTRVLNSVESLGYLRKYGAGVISDHTRYPSGFGVLREAVQRQAKAAILIELGFTPNPSDRAAITDTKKGNLMARAAAGAIYDFVEHTG